MNIGHQATLLFPPLEGSSQDDHRAISRFLAYSFLFHVLFLVLVVNVQFPGQVDKPLTPYHVSLVSLPQLEEPPDLPPKSTQKSKPVATSKNRTDKPVVKKTAPTKSQPQSISVPTPAPPITIPKERLSESFAGALEAINVPKERKLEARADVSVPPPVSHEPQPGKTTQEPKPISLPPPAPQLSSTATIPKAQQSSAPIPKEQDLLSPSTHLADDLRETAQSIAIPKDWKSRSDLPSSIEQSEDRVPASENPKVRESLKKALQSVVIPTKKNMSSTISSPSERKKRVQVPSDVPKVTESLKRKIESVALPKHVLPPIRRGQPSLDSLPPVPSARETQAIEKARAALKGVVLPPQVPELTTDKLELPNESLPSDLDRSQEQLDQKIAGLSVPKVQDLGLNPQISIDPQSTRNETANRLEMSGENLGGDPYWGRVRAKIDREWVAFPVELRRGEPPQVVITFRLERSGRMKNVVIARSSGNEYFDLAAKRAVVAASPLPPFPKNMTGSHRDLRFTFIGPEGGL